jgi:TRAP-type transport system small permease protein
VTVKQATAMTVLSRCYGALLDALMVLAALLVLTMTLMIGADVLLRNFGVGGLAWSNEVSEYILYLVTLLSAPWLLRRGQHIRVDILLRALPPRLAYLMEWLADLAGLGCALYFVAFGWRVAQASYAAGAISLKTLVLPEWWMLAGLPLAFLLVAIEFVFRMHRLAKSDIGPRAEAVSAS